MTDETETLAAWYDNTAALWRMAAKDRLSINKDACREHAERAEKTARLLRSIHPRRSVHKVGPHWFALPNGSGSDVGPYSTADQAWEWMEAVK